MQYFYIWSGRAVGVPICRGETDTEGEAETDKRHTKGKGIHKEKVEEKKKQFNIKQT